MAHKKDQLVHFAYTLQTPNLGPTFTADVYAGTYVGPSGSIWHHACCFTCDSSTCSCVAPSAASLSSTSSSASVNILLG